MGKHEKTLKKILAGKADSNIPFNDLCGLLHELGFTERIRGSHHIWTGPEVVEILNIQPKHGKAKAYQVRQVRNTVLKYQLHLKVNE